MHRLSPGQRRVLEVLAASGVWVRAGRTTSQPTADGGYWGVNTSAACNLPRAYVQLDYGVSGSDWHFRITDAGLRALADA